MADPALQSASGSTSTGAAVAVALGTTKAGSTIVSAVWCKSVATCPSVSDSQGNTYTALTSFTDPSNGRFVRLFYALNIVGGACTVTSATNGSTDSITHSVVELPPVAGVRVENHASGANTMPSVSLVGTQVNDICVMLENANGGSFVQVADLCGTNADFAKSSVFGDVTTFDGLSSGGTISISSKTTGAGSAPTAWSAVAVAFKRAIHVSQTQSNQTTATATGTTLTRTYAAAVIAGSCLACEVNCTDVASQTISVSDSVNGSWGAAVQTVDDGTKTTALFLLPNTLVGTPVVTVTFGITALNRGLWIQEVRNAAPSPLDGSAGQTQASPGSGTDAVTSGTATNANQPALILGLSFDDRTVSPVAPAVGTAFIDNGAGWTFAGGNQARLESKRITTTTAVAATFTGTTGVVPTTVMVLLDEILPVLAAAAIVVANFVPEARLPPSQMLSAGFGNPPQTPAAFCPPVYSGVTFDVPPPVATRIASGFGSPSQVASQVSGTLISAPLPPLVQRQILGVPPLPGVLPTTASKAASELAAAPLPPAVAVFAGATYVPGAVGQYSVVGGWLSDDPPLPPATFVAQGANPPDTSSGTKNIGIFPHAVRLPPVPTLMAGAGQPSQVAAMPASAPHTRPPVPGASSSTVQGAGQAAQVAVTTMPPLLLSPVPAAAAVTIAGFGSPPQVAVVDGAVQEPPLAKLPPTPLLFSGVPPVIPTAGTIVQGPPSAREPVPGLPPRLQAGAGSPAQIWALGSAAASPPFAPLPPQDSILTGAGVPSQVASTAAATIAPAPVLAAKSSTYAGFGQPPQVAVVGAPTLEPPLARLPPTPALAAGVPPVVPTSGTIVQGPPSAREPVTGQPPRLQAGAGSPSQIWALSTAAIEPPFARLPASTGLQSGAGSPAQVAAMVQAASAREAVEKTTPSTTPGAGQAPQVAAVIGAASDLAPARLPPIAQLSQGVPATSLPAVVNQGVPAPSAALPPSILTVLYPAPAGFSSSATVRANYIGLQVVAAGAQPSSYRPPIQPAPALTPIFAVRAVQPPPMAQLPEVAHIVIYLTQAAPMTDWLGERGHSAHSQLLTGFAGRKW